jgi:ribonuclease J
MTTLTFYGGVDEIGGNQILLEDGDTRLWLDFGLSFRRLGMYYADFLRPRSAAGLTDYLELGLVPRLPGAYRQDLLRPTSLGHEEPRFDGVLLTHAHIDHAGCIPFLDPRISVYCSDLTRRLLGAYQVTSRGGSTAEYTRGKFRTFGEYTSWREWEGFEREFATPERAPLEIRTFEVDHSIPGACAFLIHASEATIAYTGDLRLHGPRSDSTREFIQALEEEDIDVLITEGTRVEEQEEDELVRLLAGELKSKLGSETEVRDRGVKVSGSGPGPVFVDFAIRDFDRLRTFIEVASGAGRRLVVPLKLGYYLKELGDLLGLRLSDVELYLEPRKLGAYDEREYQVWERGLLSGENVRRSDWVGPHLGELLVHLDYYRLKELVDIRPSGGIYVHSSSEPFSEEQALDFQRFKNWLERFELKYEYLHTSGHLSREEVFDLVRRSGAKRIFPVHTRGAKDFRESIGGICEQPVVERRYEV